MKVSKNILVSIISTLVLGSTLIGGYIYFNRDTDGEVASWYSGSWLYRKSISVSNDGSTLTDEDVLITVDTQALVSNNKLQNDCDDLRFVDSNDSSVLTYWIEGGCNTSSTQIWVRIPSLPNGGKTIYMYYGNSSATKGQQEWSGKFVTMAAAACPTGWDSESDSGDTFYERFPFGSTGYGTTGGNTTHNHGYATCTTGGPSSTETNQSDGGSQLAANSHTHTNARVDIDNKTTLPPYINMVFCSNSEPNIKAGLISSFESTPTGWTRVSALDDKFPRGYSTYGTTGGESSHSHTTTGGYTTGSSGSRDESGGSDKSARGAHTHTTIAGNTDSTSVLPPYKKVLFASKDADGFAPSATIMITSAQVPLGWSRVTDLDSRLPLGSSTYGDTGGQDTHTHTVTITTNTLSSSNQGTGSRVTTVARANHFHTCSTTTNSASNLPPYVEVLFYKRKTSVTNSLNTEEIYNQSPNAPTSLLTEGNSNPNGITDLTPEFSAVFSDPDSTDTGNYYQIQVNTSADFSGTPMWDSTKTAFTSPITNGSRSDDIAYNGTTLEWDTTYYWRIKMWDNRQDFSESNWSNTAQFTMNYKPTKPSSPYTEDSTNPIKVTLTPYFSTIFSDTDTSDTGNHYQIQVNTSADFTGTSMWDSTKTAFSSPIVNNTRTSNITYTGTTLNEGITYYWRMKIWDNNNLESTWSDTSNFTTTTGPTTPSALKTNGRTNPTFISNGFPTFSAYYSDINTDACAYYEIEINSNNSFTGTVMWDTGKTATTISNNNRSAEYTYDGTALSNTGNTYYWRIRFWDTDDKVSSWSSIAQFQDTFTQLKFNGVKINGVKIQ